LPFFGDRKPFPFLRTRFNEALARISPDGRWAVYVSDESGRNEIYVTTFPLAGEKVRVSVNGGTYPRWRQDGREIFYRAPDHRLMVATVDGQTSRFAVSSVDPLFQTRTGSARWPYDVSGDGKTFVLITSLQEATSAPLTLVVNWTAGLKK
jgi:hypothetical protein